MVAGSLNALDFKACDPAVACCHKLDGWMQWTISRCKEIDDRDLRPAVLVCPVLHHLQSNVPQLCRQSSKCQVCFATL